MSYNTLLTLAGRETVALSLSGGRPAAINWMAFGDGVHEPTGFETTLVHEVHRVAITSVRPDPNNQTWVIVEAVIPTNVGGFNITEVGVFDTDGKMFAIANYPSVYKPLMTEGVARDLKVRLYLEVGGRQTVSLAMRSCCDEDVYFDACNQDYPKIKELTDWNNAAAKLLNDLPVGYSECSQEGCEIVIGLLNAFDVYTKETKTYLDVLDPCNIAKPIGQNPTTAPTQQPTSAPSGIEDIEITDADSGLILTSQNGNRYRITVEDNGALKTTLTPLSQNTIKDIEIKDPNKGLILRSLGDIRYRITVEDNGALKTTKVQ
jgi:hypothetical protein